MSSEFVKEEGGALVRIPKLGLSSAVAVNRSNETTTVVFTFRDWEERDGRVIEIKLEIEVPRMEHSGELDYRKLMRHRDTILTALGKCLHDPDEINRTCALIALSWIGDASAAPMILDRLRVETSAEVKKYVAEALGVLLKHRFEVDYAKRRGTPMEQYAVNDTVPYLAEASATAREPETREYLISALGEIGFLMGGIWRVLSNLEILMNSAP
ncbi:MAG: HEAT repeat domain-containing protein, partial [Candidatus Micrarchaeia archaeon]